MKKSVITILLIGVSIMMWRCIDPFNPPTTKADVNYLVIDGFLNASENSATIKLTRTVPITTDSASRLESGANIWLLDDNNTQQPFSELQPGVYTIKNLSLNFSSNYKLKIVTSKNIEYESEFVPVKKTPEIDSVGYGFERTTVPVKVYTHDPENKSHYYSWSYSETWSYTSAYASNLGFDETGSIVYSSVDKYHCWKSSNSTNILIGSSNGLSKDIISGLTLYAIPWVSQKLITKYSIEVEQHAITKEAYDYLDIIRKNTENLGTLFDPLPSSVVGNYKCVTKPGETVIGFFTACTVTKKRKFIYSYQINKFRPSGLRSSTGYESCELDTVHIGEPMVGWPVSAIYNGPAIVGYLTSDVSCVDCTFTGGKTTKPDFWDN